MYAPYCMVTTYRERKLGISGAKPRGGINSDRILPFAAPAGVASKARADGAHPPRVEEPRLGD